jgi:hypothetical protein
MAGDDGFIEQLCDRFMLVQRASRLTRVAFGARVGLSGPQMTNISNRRNPPSHDAIATAAWEFGFTTDFLYFGSRVGFRDPAIAERLRVLATQPAVLTSPLQPPQRNDGGKVAESTSPTRRRRSMPQ